MAVTPGGVEITSTVHAAFLPEVWASDTQDAIMFKEVLGKLVNTDYEVEVASMGRILHIPHRSNLAVQTKTEGLNNAIDFNAVTQTHQDITISTYEYSAVLLNAVVQVQSKYEDRRALAERMGYALMRGMEVAIANLFQNFSQSVGAYGGDTSDADIRRAWQYLADAGFYDGASWVFSPGAAQSIFGVDRYVSKDFQTQEPAIVTAKLPTMYGHPAYVCNLLRSPSSGAHDNALLHRSSVILVRQVKPTAKEQYRIEWNADALLIYDLYAVAEAEQPTETPLSQSGGAPATEVLSDQGAVLIRGK